MEHHECCEACTEKDVKKMGERVEEKLREKLSEDKESGVTTTTNAGADYVNISPSVCPTCGTCPTCGKNPNVTHPFGNVPWVSPFTSSPNYPGYPPYTWISTVPVEHKTCEHVPNPNEIKIV